MAAVLGAGVGVVGTLAVAALTMTATRWQVRTQAVDAHAQWRRQVRRDAYVALLNALGEVNEDLFEISMYMYNCRQPEELHTHERMLHAVAGTREVCRLAWVVELEGPEEVRGYAHVAGGKLNVWLVCLSDWYEAVRDGRDASEAEERTRAGMHEVEELIENLIAAASEVLDGVDQPPSFASTRLARP
ncbi:hypothetical protein [Streptomyces iranensis]|uniref:hypothetical protein n=1 Tax=Streptomyces iranensis TaxID=576784 RepID=UPI0039B77AB6